MAGMTSNEAPEELTLDEDKLYNMSMEELEELALNSKVEQPEEDSITEETETEVSDEPEVEVDEAESEETQDEVEDEGEESDEDTDAEEEPEESEEASNEVSEEDSEEDQSTEESADEDDKSEPQKEKTFKVKAVGTEIEFTENELKELASKGLDYTKKMQEISPWKKQIAAMKEHKVGQEDINLLIDLKKGNKDAILSMMKENGIDPMDVDIDEVKQYRPNDYSVPEEDLAVRDVVSRISQDKDVYSRTEAIVDQEWDSSSRDAMFKNPAMIEGLHNDIKTGVYEKVMPVATKLKALGGGTKTDLEYYIEAGKQLQSSQPERVVQKEEQSKSHQEDIKRNSQRRKVASLPKKRANKKKDVINYLDEIPDEDYEKWIKKVEARI